MIDKAPALSYLMKKAQEGDENAYRQVLEDILPALRSYVAKRVSNQDIVEDIVQNILVGIHQNRHTYRPDSAFMPWVFGIAFYKVTDALRSHYRYDARMKDHGDNQDHFLETISATESNSKQVEVQEDLEKALGTLDDKQAHIVKRAKIDGASIHEISEEMDMSESAVKVTIHRAIKKMRTLFSDEKGSAA